MESKLVIKEVDIYKSRGGKILEWWDFPLDYLSLLTQGRSYSQRLKC